MTLGQPDEADGPVRGEHFVRVYFADTDVMGVVYHAVYLTWFEMGRTELLRERGLSYAEVEDRGISLPVTEAHFTVRAPARYNDWIRIQTAVLSLRTREVTFGYRILRDDLLLVEGMTMHVPVAKAEGRGTRLPDWLRERMVHSS